MNNKRQWIQVEAAPKDLTSALVLVFPLLFFLRSSYFPVFLERQKKASAADSVKAVVPL